MEHPKLKQGFLQVYTGDGKGKTTCALGLALRAVGQGLKVFMIQFLKSRATGEREAARRLAPDFTIENYGLPGFPSLADPDARTVETIRRAFERAREVIQSGAYDVVILDEVNLVLAYGIISLEEMFKLLETRPPHVEVVLTGRDAPPALLEAADLVTEMRPVKHYYEAGIRARRGIEW